MFISKTIMIPKLDYEHYENLLRLKIADCNIKEYYIIDSYHLEISNPKYELVYFVHNTRKEIAFEYQLIDIHTKEWVESSDIYFTLQDEWEFTLDNDTYRVNVVCGK